MNTEDTAMLLEIVKWLLLIAAVVCVFAFRGFMLLIPVGLVLLHALLDLFTKQQRIRENEKQPVATVRATIVDRECSTIGHGRQARRRFFVSFLPEDGEMLEFQVSGAVCETLGLGDRGLLTFRGWQFLSFVPEAAQEAAKEEASA